MPDYSGVVIAVFLHRYPVGTRVRWGRRTKLRTSTTKLDGVLVSVDWDPKKGCIFNLKWTKVSSNVECIGSHHEFLSAMFDCYCDIIVNTFNDTAPRRTNYSIHASRDLQFETRDRGWQPLNAVMPSGVRRLRLEALHQWIIPEPDGTNATTQVDDYIVPSIDDVPQTVSLKLPTWEILPPSPPSALTPSTPTTTPIDDATDAYMDTLEDLYWITDTKSLDSDFVDNPINWYNPSFDDTTITPKSSPHKLF